MKNIYIDECGNTGDISLVGANQQPSFTMSSIYFSSDLMKEILKVENFYRSRKKIQQPEIKSANTFKRQEDFTSEIINLIFDSNAPIWAEVMDKKYYILCNFVSSTLLPTFVLNEVDEMYKFVTKSFVDYLDTELALDQLQPYLIACQFPTRENLIKLVSYFQIELQNKQRNDVRDGIMHALEKLHEALLDPNDPFKDKNYYPAPDYTKQNNTLIMLPYVNAFASIYSRINKWSKAKGSEKITLIHDEQKQFDSILLEYKKALDTQGMPGWVNNGIFPYADYDFKQQFQLIFKDSKEISELQYADLLAGFVTKCVEAKIHNRISSKYEILFNKFLNMNINVSTGINLVFSESNYKKITTQ